MEQLLSTLGATATSSVIRDLLRLVDRPGIISLAGGLPAAESFPVERIREATRRALDTVATYGHAALQYGPTEGDTALRGVLAARQAAAVDEVIVTSGSQQALDLVARALVDPGDVVVVESPAYLGTLQALRTRSPQFEPVVCDRNGLDVEVLAQRLSDGLRPKLVSVVPNFQNPTGSVLSLDRRRTLLDLSARYGFVIVEDDPYGPLRFAGEPLPSLWELGGAGGLVVSLGTASKLLAPGLRVGWACAPSWLMPSLVRLKQSADLHTAGLGQMIVGDLLGDVAFMDAHHRRLAEVYGSRCRALADALEGHAQFDRPDGGMFLWAATPGKDTAAALERAVAGGVAYVPGSAFGVDGGFPDRLRLSFATAPMTAFPAAVDRLVAALDPIVAAAAS